MFEVMSITGVVFVIVALGYVSVRLSLFSPDDMRVFGKFVVNFALPALVFRAVSGRNLGEILDVACLVAYGVGSVAMFGVGYAASRRMGGLSRAAATFQGMGMSCPNSGFFGYPILLMAVPALASTTLALCMVIENLILIPLVLVMAERSAGDGGGGWGLAARIAGRVARNPIVVALLLGLAVSMSGLALPGVITEPIRLIAGASAAVSLFVIGGTLGGLSFRSLDTRWVPVVAGKLVAHPLAVWLVMTAAGALGLVAADPTLAHATILVAAMPTMGIYTILAQRYGQQDAAALAMLMMTTLSFLTISAFLWLLLP